LTRKQSYQKAASYVPQLTTTIISYLEVQPTDHILDTGCGDGKLTVELAKQLTNGKILGVDYSGSMIQAGNDLAKELQLNNCSFDVVDCSTFEGEKATSYLDGSWDKVFSNAAYHWILRQPESRVQALTAVYNALKSGGKFVFECGGHGNIAELQTAITAALLAHGVSLERAQEINPWFFPDGAWMEQTLKGIGFQVDLIELEYRPTKLTPKDASGGGGLEGWIRLFGASMLENLENKDQIVTYACNLLENVVTKPDEERSQWVGYVRLRGIATKPV
jgi:SAM-dependent methyltransferase